MEWQPILAEMVGMMLRWLHVIAGIAWIGSSFYFMHLDAAIRPAPGSDIPEGKGGEAWEVHGGGFYQVRKWLVAPTKLPDHMMWHKWESYATWLSGFSLLCWVYYGSADLFLIDPAVREMGAPAAAAIGIGALLLGWGVYDGLCRSPLASNELWLGVVGFVFVVAVAFGFQQLFSGRGAMVHTGALMATWMTGNVLMVIIPNQRKAVKALLAGQEPDPALGKQGKIRSTHNNYLTLPVLFLMLSSHYPMVWSTPYAFVIVGLVLIAGAEIRVFYNLRHAGKGDHWLTWAIAAMCMVLVAAISLSSTEGGREFIGLAAAGPGRLPPGRAAPPGQVVDIVTSRCAMCHAAQPSYSGIAVAPKGVRLDTPAWIGRHAPEIRMQSVLSHAMPPNNITRMEPAERQVLAGWLGVR